jgi:hypothetical protein
MMANIKSGAGGSCNRFAILAVLVKLPMSSAQLPSSILYTKYMSYGDVFMSRDSVQSLRNPDYVTNLAILNLSDIPTLRHSTHF